MPATASSLYKEEETETSKRSPVLDQQLNIRFSDEDIERIDAALKKLESSNPGLKVSRSEMGRILVLKGLSDE